MHCLARDTRSGTPADFHSDNSRRMRKQERKGLEQFSTDRLAKEAKITLGHAYADPCSLAHAPYLPEVLQRGWGTQKGGGGMKR